MTGPATSLALQRLAQPLRVRAVLGWVAITLGGGALLLGAAAWIVGLGWFDAPYWVLLAWAGVAVVCVVVAWLAWSVRTRLSAGGVAGGLEELGAWRHGALTALLDRSAAGTSSALLEWADRLQADDVARRGVSAAEPLARPVRVLGLAGLGALALGLAAFGSAGPLRGPAAALWHPARAWEATVAPVRIRAARGVVDRGDSTALELEAFGRRHATLWLRAPGEGWRPTGVSLDSTGRAQVTTGALQSDLFARLTSGSRASDTVVIRVRLPVFLGTLSVTAHYPAYLHLEAEPVPTGGDTLLLPAGTRLETRGEATAPLATAAWAAGGRRAELSVKGGRFTGSFVPQSSGEYHLALATGGGAPLTSDTVRLPIRLVVDSAPRVDVPVPGADTLAPISLQVPLVVDARDDHGISGVTVESRRVRRLGGVDSARRETVSVPAGTPDRAILTHTLDLTRRGLLPGDTLRYFALAADNTPQRQTGRSREYVLRLPTMSEVRAAQRQASDAVAGRLDSLSAASTRLQRQTDDLARERPRPAEGQGEKLGESLSFEEAKKAESIAQSQQELMRQAESLKQSLESLRKSAEAAGLGDTAWQRELSEIREQLERALSPELRERLQELQQALKDLDAERTKEALERLAETQRETREALERSRELFRRAALEGDLANLSKESKALAQEQREWNEQVSGADSARSARAERELAARADSLAGALEKLSQAMGDSARQERLDAAGDQAEQAGQHMKQAASASQQGQRGKAKQKGEQAEQSLEPLGDQLQQERESMQQEWRQEVVAAIDQALAETSRLAERQLAVQERLRSGGDAGGRVRAEQAPSRRASSGCSTRCGRQPGRTRSSRPRSARRSGAPSGRCSGPARPSPTPRPTRAKPRSRPAARWTRSTRRPTSWSGPGGTSRARARARDWPRRWNGWRSWPSSRAVWASRVPGCCRWPAMAPCASSSGSWA